MPGMRKTAIAAITLLGYCGVAAADPITILRDGRSVSASGSLASGIQFFFPPSILLGAPASSTREQTQRDNLSVLARASGLAGEVVSDAFLISDISDPRHISGFGQTQTFLLLRNSGIGDAFDFFAADAQGEADMTFAVDFRLASPFDFVLGGHASHASLSGAGSVFFDLGGGLGPNSSQAGHLNPGDYAFVVQNTAMLKVHQNVGTFGDSSSFSFKFDLTPSAPAPTPEPASLLLLATGVVGAFGFRSRRANPTA